MKRISGLITAVAVMAAAPAAAQLAADVKFRPGDYGTMLGGAIRGQDYFDYRLSARAGQKLFVDLSVDGTNGHGSIYLNVLPPGSDNVAIYNGSTDVDRTETIILPETGTYTLRLYLMGNDRDTGKTVGYNLDVSIQ